MANSNCPKCQGRGFVMDKDIRQESDVKPEIPPQENKEFLPKIKTSRILQDALGSDHCPILLTTSD